MSPNFVRLTAYLILGCLAAGSLHAETLATVRTGELPPPPEPAVAVCSIDGYTLALNGDAVRVLAPGAHEWTLTRLETRGRLVALVGGERSAFAFIRSESVGEITHVERLDRTNGVFATSVLPSLPVVLTGLRAALGKDVLYAAGRSSRGAIELYALDLAGPAADWKLEAMRSGDLGTDPTPTSIAVQTSALWFTTEEPNASSGRLWRWSKADGWQEKGAVPGRVVAGGARATGQAHVLYLLKTPGDIGGDAKLYSFQTITGSWAALATVSAGEARATGSWRDGIVWTRSGATGETLSYVQLESGRVLLRWLDWILIIVYLATMLGMGLYFYVREKRTSTSDFFLGGRTIPFWAAGVSLYTANTSSISYIAIPAKAFETNWQYLTNNLVAILGLMFVAVWIVPLLRRLDLMSVFHYLETRFHPAIRALASGLFMAVQIGSRMSVILFLPSLAIATITGIDVIWSILIMGVFTMIYTALGGMKAVIWTDFVQLIVKMGGIIFAIGFIVYMLHGGFGELLTIASAEHKMKLFDWHWDLTKATVWGFIFLVLFDVVLTFPKDQVLMQRVLSTKSDRDAGRSIWTFAAIMLPGGFLFYFTGTALFAYYKTHPERMDPLLSIDATFPLFIAAELPMGVRGLIIAGILAAAMATLSSIMNSVATLASVDFYEKLVKQPNPRVSVRFAEAMTIVTGLLGMGVAILLTRYDIHSLFDISIELAGLLGGGFAGAYTLGMFTRRANWQGVAIGVTVSISLTTTAWLMKLVHPYFYLAISIFLCITVGYAASWFFPPPKLVEGLTIFSPKTK